MSDRRRRGKSVVFDQPPSLVTTGSGDSTASFLQRRRSSAFKRIGLREVLIVLSFIAGVVWLILKLNKTNTLSHDISYGSKMITQVSQPFIVPSHFAGSSGRDGLKKAPADKQGQGLGNTDVGASKKAGVFYQFVGDVSPKFVVLTVIDDKLPRDFMDKIIENRLEYCQAHGFGLLMKYVSEFQKYIDVNVGKHSSWARVFLSHEAQFSFPDAEWFWYLDDSSLIMDPDHNVYEDLLNVNKLKEKMIPGVPVMRYRNQYIQTYSNTRASDITFVSSLDNIGISTTSYFFKNTFVSHAYIEIWGEPLLRNSTDTKTEQLALGHLLQWHSQLLVRTAIVSNKEAGTYAVLDEKNAEIKEELSYKDGDFVAIFGCDLGKENCKREFSSKWAVRKRASQPMAKETSTPQVARDQVQNQVQVEAQERAQEKAEKQKHDEEDLVS